MRCLCLSLQACQEGDLLATTKLLALGAEVNCNGTSSSTTPSPLHAAIAAGSPQLVDLLIRQGAQPTVGPSGDPLSVAAEMLLQEAVAAGLHLPEELKRMDSSSAGDQPTAAAGDAPALQQSLLRSITVLSWVEGEMSTLMGGPVRGCPCCKKDDFLHTAAGVPSASSLIWPFGDPLEVCQPCCCC